MVACAKDTDWVLKHLTWFLEQSFLPTTLIPYTLYQYLFLSRFPWVSFMHLSIIHYPELTNGETYSFVAV